MSDTIKSTDAIDKKVMGSTNFEQLRESLLQELEKQGTIQRDRTDAYGVRVVGPVETDAPLQTDAPLPAGVDHNRVFRVVYPSGNNRFEIYGANDAELDERERQIRAMFST